VNKTTAAVKEALTMAYEGIGGVETMKLWAQDNQTEFYKLWSKLLPQEVNAAVTLDEGLADQLNRARQRASGA